MTENQLSERIIGAAIEVHRVLGPGLVELPYEEAICHELGLRGLSFQRQQAVRIIYKGAELSSKLRLDLILDQRIIVDLKAKAEVPAVDKAKLRTYLRLSQLHLGLIINFHVERLVDGIVRVVNRLDEPADLELPPDFRA
jgi:GxxExxY protein